MGEVQGGRSEGVAEEDHEMCRGGCEGVAEGVEVMLCLHVLGGCWTIFAISIFNL